jgi:aryl-alcohol dehydrogenase-like predicted oxidoreductase
MKYRTFGRTNGLRVSEIGLGAGLFGTHEGITGRSRPGEGADVARAVFEAYAEAGGNFIDTAEGYQAGESERLVGELVGRDRENFVIASKYAVGIDRTDGHGRLGNSRKAMMSSIEGTLRRLGTDYVDLYWLHAHDAVTPMEEILRGLDDLVRAGKVRYGGLGNFPAWRVSRGHELAAAHGWAPIAAITAEYGVAERSAERELLPMAEALGLGFGAWSPLGSGFLTGTYPGTDGDEARLLHWVSAGRPTQADLAVRDTVAKVASELGATPAQVGLAWVLDRARRSATALVPITSAPTAADLTENLHAVDLALSTEDIERLDSASGFSLGEPHVHNLEGEAYVTSADLIRPAVPAA